MNNKMEMSHMHEVILACTYTFRVKSRNTVRLPETNLILRVLNFETFAIFSKFRN